MQRRQLLSLTAAGLAALSLPALAQQEPRVRRIGYLSLANVQPNVPWPAAFREGMAELRWPAIGWSPEFADDGLPLAYGPDFTAVYRRAAHYADRILRGAKPGDLPIEQPTTFQLVMNLKTAKAMGITFPQSFLVRADRVIE